jgi:general secretion pathway protein B
MSYVLEALRRAEAERQRGNVPGLHAQTLPSPEAVAAEPDQTSPSRGVWMAAWLLLLALLLAAAGWGVGRGPSTGRDAPPVVAAEAPAPPPVVVLPPPPPAPVVRAPARPAAPAVAENPDRIVKLEDLPDALRRQIPPLAFGGATHSSEPSARMLIVNGQIWREGDELAPGLKLERIELRAAQFRFRDRRFEMAY